MTVDITYDASTSTRWWLKDPVNPSRNMQIDVVGDSIEFSSKRDGAVFEAIGRSDYIVISDVIRKEKFTITFEFLVDPDTEYAAFNVLRNSGNMLLLQSALDTGEQWYIQIVGERRLEEMNTTPVVKRVTVECVEVDDGLIEG